MDAGAMCTSRKIIRARVAKPKDILAFTICGHDYSAMKRNRSRVQKRRIDAETLYKSKRFHSGYHVVNHDSMGLARTEINSIRILLENRPAYLAIMINIVPRCGKLSHQKFVRDVCRIARDNSMKTVVCQQLPTYRQGARGAVMWPFWFEFCRK